MRPRVAAAAAAPREADRAATARGGAGGGGRSASRASSPASLRSGSSLSRANFSKIPGFGDLPEGVLAAGHAAMRSRSGWICGLGIFLGGVLWYGSPPWWGI